MYKMDVNSWTSNRFMHNSQQVNVFIHNNNFQESQLTEVSTAHQEHEEHQQHIEETRVEKIEEIEDYHPLEQQQQQQQQQRENKSGHCLSKWTTFTKRLKQIFGKIMNFNKFPKENVSLAATRRNVQAFSLKMQERFDEHIDHILHDIIDKNFANSLNEFHLKFASNLTNIDLFNLMANCLLENTLLRFKKQISTFPTNHVRYIGNTARHEVIYNGVNGRYRRLFNGFDISIPPADVASSDGSNHTFSESNMLRRKIFWDINRITGKSKFVLNIEADKLFKAKTKCHKCQGIQYRHLMRYVADAQDIQWLQQQQQQQQLIRIEDNLNKRRILLLLWEQLVDLQKAHNCYADYDLTEMHSFTVPEFIIRKIRLSCIRIQIRSNGIITTIPIRKKQLQTDNPKSTNQKTKRRQQSINIQSRLKRNINHMNKLSSITEGNIRNSSHLIFGAFLNNPISASGSYKTAIVYTPRNRSILI